jgi:hypothetical protein
MAVALQHSVRGAGRTDIELETEHAHLVLEAKRGWDLPRGGQLEQYASRLQADRSLARAIAVVGEGSADWAVPQLPGARRHATGRYFG